MGLRLVPIEGEPEAPLLHTGFNDVQGQLSPGSRRLAYASDESDTFEVYVREFQRRGGKVRVSHRGGSQPR